MNPVDWLLDRAIPDESRLGTVFLALYTTPAVVTLSSVLQFAVAPESPDGIRVALGVAIALCVMLALVMAVLRRLILGSRDWETSDVQLPRFASGWAVSLEPSANNSIYFLVLVYLSTLGFAALYFSLALSDPTAFANFGHASVITALYLSITTLATVGYGDIHATSNLARIAIILQVSTGPLILSWLLSVFLTAPSKPSDSEQTRLPRTE
jgi:hypothetical protein